MTRHLDSAEGPKRGAKVTSQLLAFVAFIKLPGLILAPIAGVFGWLLAPVILPQLARVSRGFWCLVVLATACIPVGVSMRFLASAEEYRTSSLFDLLAVLVWVSAFAVVPALGLYLAQSWSLVGVLRISIVGALVGAALISPALPWKGSIGLYATVLALTCCIGRPLFVSQMVLILSAVLSSLSDARGMALFALLAFAATFVSAERARSLVERPVRSTLLALLFGVAAVFVVYRAMLSGFLGEEAQLRTLRQATVGNPILGARVEWAAALEVFKARPTGYGTGVITADGVQSAAVSEVQYAGGDYTATYFTDTVFGQRHDFHSAMVDLWYHFGPVGAALSVVLLGILVSSIPLFLTRKNSFGVIGLYVTVAAVWDVLFSPMGGSDRIAFALFICAVARTELSVSGGADPDDTDRPADTRTANGPRLRARRARLSLSRT